MGFQQQMLQKPEEKKSGFDIFSDRVTTSLAALSGGAAIGSFIAGPVGGTVGALVSGVAGFLVTGSHDSLSHKPKS